MDPALTRRQRAIYEYLRTHQARFANPPTLDELCQALGLRSRGSLHKHVQALVHAGLIEPLHGRRRGIRLIRQPTGEEDELPLLGFIAAGRPIEAVVAPETITVPEALRGRGPCYVLQVRGDSMIEAGIFDRDWIVVEARDQARDGELVVALIDGEEATLKHIEQRVGEVLLHPANSALQTQRYAPERVRIQGVVVGQMRRYGR